MAAATDRPVMHAELNYIMRDFQAKNREEFNRIHRLLDRHTDELEEHFRSLQVIEKTLAANQKEFARVHERLEEHTRLLQDIKQSLGSNI